MKVVDKGPTMKAIGERGDRADIASRLNWKRSAKRQREFGRVSGDRVLLKNAQVTASPTGPFAPEMYAVTQTMGALLSIRSVDTGKVKTVRNENCKMRRTQLRLATRRGGKPRRATLPRYSRTQQQTKRMSQCSRATKTGQ